MSSLSKKLIKFGVVLVALAALAWFAWTEFRPEHDTGFTHSNGRIEATAVDVAAKMAGRVSEVLVNEGDFVTANQVVARMDVKSMQAQMAQARAQLASARSAKVTSQAQVAQRQADAAMAKAVLIQRRSELDIAQKTFKRSRALLAERATSAQQADDDAARFRNAEASIAVAQAQIAAVEAGIQAAQSQVTQSEAAIDAAQAVVDNLQSELDDAVLRAPRAGRIQYRIVQPGEVVGPGGKIVSLVDLADVYMTFFLPETVAGRVALGAEAHLILDAIPQYVIPAEITYVSSVAQFTPKAVETLTERQKLVFRVKARIDPNLLEKHIEQVKTGLPGVAYVRLDPDREWPENLQIKLP